MHFSRYTVYILHNLLNDKVYIGITCQTPENRWRNGCGYSYNKHFSAAIEKYGWDNFEHIIFAKDVSKESACEIEKDLIMLYNSNDPEHGYNISSGGEAGAFKHGLSGLQEYKNERKRNSRRAKKELEATIWTKVICDKLEELLKDT